MNRSTKIVAAVFALTAFIVAAISGLGAGNTAETTLLRATLAMFVCYFAGLPLGMICDMVVEEHVNAYTAKNPVGQTGHSPAPEKAAENDEEPIVV